MRVVPRHVEAGPALRNGLQPDSRDVSGPCDGMSGSPRTGLEAIHVTAVLLSMACEADQVGEAFTGPVPGNSGGVRGAPSEQCSLLENVGPQAHRRLTQHAGRPPVSQWTQRMP